jgi:hypothetical protein
MMMMMMMMMTVIITMRNQVIVYTHHIGLAGGMWDQIICLSMAQAATNCDGYMLNRTVR